MSEVHTHTGMEKEERKKQINQEIRGGRRGREEEGKEGKKGKLAKRHVAVLAKECGDH